MTWKELDDDVKESIFCWLLEMINNVSDLKRQLKGRGDYVIDKKGRIGILGKHVIDVEFYHSILIWHIATDLCSSNESEHSMKRRETSQGSKTRPSPVRLGRFITASVQTVSIPTPDTRHAWNR